MNVCFRQVTTGRVDGQFTSQPEAVPPFTKGSAFPPFAESVFLELHRYEGCEGVVELDHIHIPGRNP